MRLYLMVYIVDGDCFKQFKSQSAKKNKIIFCFKYLTAKLFFEIFSKAYLGSINYQSLNQFLEACE